MLTNRKRRTPPPPAEPEHRHPVAATEHWRCGPNWPAEMAPSPTATNILTKNTEVWVPAAFSKRELANRDAHYLTVAARLKPRITLQQAQADMESVARRIEEKNPVAARNLRVVIVPLRE